MTNCRVTICRTIGINKVQSDSQADLNSRMRKIIEDNRDVHALTNGYMYSVIKVYA